MMLFSSLTNRIFAASALLAVGAIAIAVLRVNVSVTDRAEADLRAGLEEAAALVEEVRRTQFDHFVREGRLVADLPKFKAAVAVDDPATAQPIAADYQQQIQADLFVVTNRAGRVVAQAGRIQPSAATLVEMLAGERPAGEATWFWPYGAGVLQVAALPISIEPGPELLGTLVVGFGLDRSQAERIRRLTNSHIAILAGGTIVAATLPAAERSAELTRAAAAGGTFELTLDGEEYTVRAQPFGPADAAAPVALVLRSRTEHLRFLGRLQREMAVAGAVAVLAATLVGYMIARTVTRPLRAITATMREIAATGDLARAVPPTGRWDDEDARLLAASFRQLTTALDAFQREAAQRERLSSLGRLSTVIAHEVRNPLMIIKTALRTLRRGGEPGAVTAAADSIEEEVQRLNRVVTDVLDFARPIPYDLAPADLGELARDAARAVGVGPDAVEVTVDAPATPARLVTDAERLRAVLVNLFANAQHAVRERHPSPDAAPAVVARVARAGAGWEVEVTDRGTGIGPADLPRIFDPFFTTRRTGSGLGLALARNVVEGLGGTIEIRSTLASGTTATLVLPDPPLRRESSSGRAPA